MIKLVEDGFMTREKQGRSYHLGLTPAGERSPALSRQLARRLTTKNLRHITVLKTQAFLEYTYYLGYASDFYSEVVI